MRAPPYDAGGNIPGTSWFAIPPMGRKAIPNLRTYAKELRLVVAWLKLEIRWAEDKAKRGGK